MVGRPAFLPDITAQLDQLLEHAAAGPGLAIITTNPHRLNIALRARIREARKVHPEAYASLSILSSKSPKELYLVNRQAAGSAPALRGADDPTERGGEPRPSHVALSDLPSTRDGSEGNSQDTGKPQETN